MLISITTIFSLLSQDKSSEQHNNLIALKITYNYAATGVAKHRPELKNQGASDVRSKRPISLSVELKDLYRIWNWTEISKDLRNLRTCEKNEKLSPAQNWFCFRIFRSEDQETPDSREMWFCSNCSQFPRTNLEESGHWLSSQLLFSRSSVCWTFFPWWDDPMMFSSFIISKMIWFVLELSIRWTSLWRILSWERQCTLLQVFRSITLRMVAMFYLKSPLRAAPGSAEGRFSLSNLSKDYVVTIRLKNTQM